MSSAPTTGASTSTATFRLRVRGADRAVREIEVAAATEAEAARHAAARGLSVLAFMAPHVPRQALHGEGRFALVLFSQELLALLDAGLNLTEAMTTLLAKERRPAARQVLQRVVHELREGRNFSDVLERMPRHFPQIYVATVRASERTGDIGPALARYVAYQLQFDTLQRRLVSALIYPAMLLVVGGFVTLFLLGYVVPRMSAVYDSAGRDMPWLSGVLLAVGRGIDQHWAAVIAAVSAVVAVVAATLVQSSGRRFVADRLLRVPVIARKAREFRLARFYRALGLLLSAGIALPKAMGMVDGLVGPQLRPRLQHARAAVEQGKTLSAALLGEALVGPVAESLIKVGERSGQLAPLLERTARFHDDDLGRWVDWASRLLEPVLMLMLGIVIGGVVVLLYMPIFELAGSLQ